MSLLSLSVTVLENVRVREGERERVANVRLFIDFVTFNSQEQCHRGNLVFALNVNICMNVERVNKF